MSSSLQGVPAPRHRQRSLLTSRSKPQPWTISKPCSAQMLAHDLFTCSGKTQRKLPSHCEPVHSGPSGTHKHSSVSLSNPLRQPREHIAGIKSLQRSRQECRFHTCDSHTSSLLLCAHCGSSCSQAAPSSGVDSPPDEEPELLDSVSESPASQASNETEMPSRLAQTSTCPHRDRGLLGSLFILVLPTGGTALRKGIAG